MIDLSLHEKQIERNARRCAERNIILPTFAQMRDPSSIPGDIVSQLSRIGRDEVHSRNLFRITWENAPDPGKNLRAGEYAGPNYIEIPPEISGVKARIIALVGRWFPTGAHKVGAAYSCLAPTLITGQFDPERNMAVWPSTGNYCRGGAYISRLLGCKSIAILPEEMSAERFTWLKTMADETIATPGCESNVKEIFDKCHELDAQRGESIFIFNQFEQLGNHLWHHEVTGPAMEKLFLRLAEPGQRFAGAGISSGSAGTTASGEYMKSRFPGSVLAVSEAQQCPTLLNNGFGGHRIEGIGDKHVPWIHNVRNTDMVVAVDDEASMRLLRLFNEDEGQKYLGERGVKSEVLEQLWLLGISGICNLLTVIKMAKYYEMDENDVLMTVFTDSEQMYTSRLAELRGERGSYRRDDALADYQLLQDVGVDWMQELTYPERKRVHNLKYYTWVEQQGKDMADLNRQWYERSYWQDIYDSASRIDRLIIDFNNRIASYS